MSQFQQFQVLRLLDQVRGGRGALDLRTRAMLACAVPGSGCPVDRQLLQLDRRRELLRPKTRAEQRPQPQVRTTTTPRGASRAWRPGSTENYMRLLARARRQQQQQ
jgi:hypothetical protein